MRKEDKGYVPKGQGPGSWRKDYMKWEIYKTMALEDMIQYILKLKKKQHSFNSN